MTNPVQWVTTDELAADPDIPVRKAWLARERGRALRGEPHFSPPFYRIGGRILYRRDEVVEWAMNARFERK